MNQYGSFALATAERAVKTFAQALGALIAADGTHILNTAWGDRLSVAVMATLLSILSSVVSAPVGDPGPSLVGETTDPAAAAEELKPPTHPESPYPSM